MARLSGFRRVLRGSAIFGLGGMANRLVTLLLLPVFTAYLTPSEYGVVAMLTAAGAFVTPIFTLGLGSSIGIAYFNTQDSVERRAIVWTAGAVLLTSAALLVLTGWFMRQSLSHIVLSDERYGLHTAVAMGTTAVGVLSLPWQLKLQFEQRPTAFVSISFLGLLATLGMSLWFVVRMGYGAMGALLGSLVGQTIGALLLLLVAARGPAFSHMKRWLRELLKHGLPLVPSFFFLFLLQHWARWPLEWHHGLGAVGVYSVGASIGAALGILTGAFISAWTPFALSHAARQAEAVDILADATLYYIAAFGFLCTLFFLLAVPVVQLFAQPAFLDGAKVVGLSAGAQFLSALFLMLLPPLYYAKRVDNVITTQAIATLATFLVAHLLIPRFDITGAGVATMLGFAILVVVQWIALRALPVLRIRYDYWRAGLLLALFSTAAALSFLISFADTVSGLAAASAIAIVTAAVTTFGIFRVQEIRQAWKHTV